MVSGIIVKCFMITLITYVVSMVVGTEMCDETPHPVECKTLLSQQEPIRSTTQFLKVCVEQTLDGAIKAKNDTDPLETILGSTPAWEDCMDLYEHTIYRLNESMLCSTNVCSSSDVQAWLSTALTNLETCKDGMLELGVSSDSLQSVTINIINALAINNAFNQTMEPNGDGFGTSEVGIKPPSISKRVDVVVAQDGSGDYKTIQEAVDGAGTRSKRSPRYVILVKQGVYKEYVKIGINSNNIMILGDGIGKTIITGDRSKIGGYTTYKSATFVVEGDGFVGRDITIRNTAGPENKQAVALRSDSDKSVFYKCSFEGYQDTLYAHSGRQFFRQCDIYGTVDFIFGNAAAVFQNCSVFTRYPPGGVNTITAQSRVNPNQTTGFVIHNSVVRGAPGIQLGGVKTYLGRPWRGYARTVVMGTFLDALIEPKGWLDWDNETALSTLYYGEYQNSGPGSSTKNRVNWPGFHVISDINEARRFTLHRFIHGATWLPPTQVPFSISL